MSRGFARPSTFVQNDLRRGTSGFGGGSAVPKVGRFLGSVLFFLPQHHGANEEMDVVHQLAARRKRKRNIVTKVAEAMRRRIVKKRAKRKKKAEKKARRRAAVAAARAARSRRLLAIMEEEEAPPPPPPPDSALAMVERASLEPDKERRKTKLHEVMEYIRSTVPGGVPQLMKEIRERKEENAKTLKRMMTGTGAKGRRSFHERRPSVPSEGIFGNESDEEREDVPEHPYLALRKRIEALTFAEDEGGNVSATYGIRYKPFLNRPRFKDTVIPIYATGYDNQRKKQARKRQFMFGAKPGEGHYVVDDEEDDYLDEYANDPKHLRDKVWNSRAERHLALMAIIFSITNLMRFPQACYVNGGMVFFLVYSFVMLTLIQPLILFEMLIGQCSYNGEWGFSQLHRYSKGFIYALLFVSLVFQTLQSTTSVYTGLYFVGGYLLYPHPGVGDECVALIREMKLRNIAPIPPRSNFTPSTFSSDHQSWGCIPYSKVESYATYLTERRKQWVDESFNYKYTKIAKQLGDAEVNDGRVESFYDSDYYLSTELFYRLYILKWASPSDDNPQFVVNNTGGSGSIVSAVEGHSPFHTLFLVVFVVLEVCFIASCLFYVHLVSLSSKVWIYCCCVLPLLLIVLIFHQIIWRGGDLVSYLNAFQWNKMNTVLFWRDVLEFSLSTVCVGYGVLLRVAGRNDFRFNRLNRLAWTTTCTAILFCLICTFVVYNELSILHEIVETVLKGNKQDVDHATPNLFFQYLISEGLGVTFICFSGALVKLLPYWLAVFVFFFITVFNSWPLLVATQMATTIVKEHFVPSKFALWITARRRYGNKRGNLIQRAIALCIVLLFQLALICVFIYYVEVVGVTGGFDVLGGSSAACIIILAEMYIAFVLLGFREFMTDIEIMLNTPMTFAFQVKMKIFVPALVCLSFLLTNACWFAYPPHYYASGQHENNPRHASAKSAVMLGFLLNLAPLAILALIGYYGIRKSKRVIAPLTEYSKIAEKRKGVKKFWKHQHRWVARRGGITGTNRRAVGSSRHGSKFSAFEGDEFLHAMSEHEATLAYNAHVDLKNRLRGLLAHLRAKLRWMTALDQIIERDEDNWTIHKAVVALWRKRELEMIELELSLVRRLLHNCSALNLAACTFESMQGLSLEAQEAVLLDNLVINFDLYSSSSDEDEDEEESEEDDTVTDWTGHEHGDDLRNTSSATTFTSSTRASIFTMLSSKAPTTTNTSASSSPRSSVAESAFRRTIGRPKRSEQEMKLDVVVRIRKALDLPWEGLDEDREALREKRMEVEWEVVQKRYDNPPREQFITVKITRRGDPRSVVTRLRVVILDQGEHYVLKRLTAGGLEVKPVVIHTSKEDLTEISFHLVPFSDEGVSIWEVGAGGDSSEVYDPVSYAIFHLVMSALKERLKVAPLSDLEDEEALKFALTDHLEEHTYTFLDPLKSAIVVVTPKEKTSKWRWMTTARDTSRKKEEDRWKGVKWPLVDHQHTWQFEETTVAHLMNEKKEMKKVIDILAKRGSSVVRQPSSPLTIQRPPPAAPTTTTEEEEESSSSSEEEFSSTTSSSSSDESSKVQQIKKKKSSLKGDLTTASSTASITSNESSETLIAHLYSRDRDRRRAEFQIPIVIIEDETGKDVAGGHALHAMVLQESTPAPPTVEAESRTHHHVTLKPPTQTSSMKKSLGNNATTSRGSATSSPSSRVSTGGLRPKAGSNLRSSANNLRVRPRTNLRVSSGGVGGSGTRASTTSHQGDLARHSSAPSRHSTRESLEDLILVDTFNNLRNTFDDFYYYSDGHTLVVVQKGEEEVDMDRWGREESQMSVVIQSTTPSIKTVGRTKDTKKKDKDAKK